MSSHPSSPLFVTNANDFIYQGVVKSFSGMSVGGGGRKWAKGPSTAVLLTVSVNPWERSQART